MLAPDGQALSYGQLLSEVLSLATGFRPREIVGLRFYSTVPCVLSYLAILQAGAVPLLLDANSSEETVTNLLNRFRVRSIFDGNSATWLHRDLGTPAHADLALLLCTSGSLSGPKLVRLSKENLFSNAMAIREYLAITAQDRAITALPLHYSYGLSVLHSHLLAGASLVVTAEPVTSTGFWSAVMNFGVTGMAAVPSLWRCLRKLKIDKMHLPALKTLTVAGGRLDLSELRWLASWAVDSGRRFFAMYGQTEATARISYVPAESALLKAGSIGVPIPGGRMWIADESGRRVDQCGVEGEICYSGPNVMLGYAESPADLGNGRTTTSLSTGDIGYCDHEGYYWLTGRRSRFVKVDGRRVGLDDVERVLRSAGLNAHAVGTDECLMVACTSEFDPVALNSLLHEKMGLLPRHIFAARVSDIPTSSAGKTQYSNLLQTLQDLRGMKT